ncbi:MAG: FAD-binding oxidoreductase [Thermogemmatispora sp.]|uniref:FAD-binding oxidoreductase n=1 Tax=Thermogemmatispora sp. TaxID=1968838 RepID=UPI0019FAB2A5|nr:FAD-binding oxidoreductase [Thermogemmatispora sp.]MBE3568338.1 FAD-binding oxidoreductase [Thermogemmatispora sp.]
MAIEERSSAINASALQTNLRGQVIQKGEAAYEAARRVYNAMIDKRPALIVRCADVADVITAVNFARDHELPLSIRSGSHNAGGLGICDDGLVIDLSLLRYTHVDPDRRTARVGAGCTWGDVDHATHAFGLAVPSGIISTTGVGGLTLGGGLGHLTRTYGLAIDNLLEATTVLADGSVVVASEQQHPDLFWGLRGGGGNFGVVTSFLFRTQPVDTVYAGPMLWELEKAPEILHWYQNLITTAPEDLNGFFAFLTVPPGPPFPEHLHNKKVCGVVWCYTGPLDRAEQTFQPIRQFRQPALDLVGPLPFPALQSMFDALYPPGLQWYWKADFVKELSDEAIRLHMQHGSQLPTLHSTMHLYPVNGAASHVSNNATAWSYRDATWAEVIVGVSPDPAQKETITDWARAYWTALHPYAESGAYVNFMMEGEGDERVRAAYRENYERLSQVKRHYDPANLFRINQNIQPAL